MRSTSLTRRELLKGAALSAAGAALMAGCQPQVVEKIVTEEKVVKETVIVEKAGEITQLRHHVRAGNWPDLYGAKMAEFNADNPNAKIILEEIPGGDKEYVPKLMALHAAGSIGDSCWTSIGSVNHYQYADMGITTPLDEMIDSTGFDKSPYYTESWESSKYQGKVFGLPALAHPGSAMLVYNKTLFEEEGIPEPNEDWTLDDLLEHAKHFTRDTKGDGRVDTWGFHPYTGRLINMLVRCFSGYEYDMINPEGTKAMISAPKTKEALRWISDLYQKHKVAPTPEAREMGFSQLFIGGRVAMYNTGCWAGPGITNAMVAKRDFPMDWWVTPLPKGPSGVLGAHAEVDLVCVLSQSTHKDLAFDFIKRCVDKESGVLVGLKHSCMGARGDIYDDPRTQGNKLSSDDEALFRVYVKINSNAGPYYYPENLHGQEAFSVYGQALQPLWLGKEEPTDAFFDDVNKQLQTVLDKPKAGEA